MWDRCPWRPAKSPRTLPITTSSASRRPRSRAWACWSAARWCCPSPPIRWIPSPGIMIRKPSPSTRMRAGSTMMTRPSRWTGRRSRSCWGSLRPSARPLSSPTWRTTPSTAWTTPPAPSSWPRRRRAIPSSWATTATWTSSGMSPPGTATCTWRSATPWTCMIPISAASSPTTRYRTGLRSPA